MGKPKWWSLLFSWAFGSFLIARNWKALGETKRAKRSMIWFYSCFLWFLVASFLPPYSFESSIYVPWKLLAGLALLGIWATLEAEPQAKLLKSQYNNNYPRKKWGIPIWIGIGSLAVVLTLFELAAIPNGKSTEIAYYSSSTGQYGTELEFKGSRVFYTSAVTETEAKNLGHYLEQSGWFDPANPVAVQIDKTYATYEFNVIEKTGIENDPDAIEILRNTAGELSRDVFNNADVDINLCDDHFHTIRTVVNFNQPN